MFSILVSSLILIVGLNIIYSAYKKFMDAINIAEEMRELNQEISSWDKVVAKVTKIEIGCDYDFPGLEPDNSHVEGNLAKEKFNIEFNKNLAKKLEERALYGQVNITYKYIIDDQSWESRAISLFPSDSDSEMAKKLKPGSKIKAFVNPKDHSEAYIRKIKKEEIEQQLNSMIISSVPTALIGVFVVFLSIISYFSDIIPN